MNLLILKGLLIGFIISISIGPIAFIIIQKSEKNYLKGLIAGLGVTSVDTFYSIIAGLGVKFITRLIEQNQIFISFIGIILILIIGIKIFFTKNESKNKKTILKSMKINSSDYFSTFTIELFNPLTFFMLIFIFNSFDILSKVKTNIQFIILNIGVFMGAYLWWSIIVIISKLFHNKFKHNIKSLNKIIGGLIIVFDLILLVNLIINKII